MTRRKVIDTFMVNAEFDMLTCRLAEMSPAVDWFIAVEADVDHQDHPKPYHLSDSIERFAPWLDKLIVVKATDLPTTPHLEDPWAREVAQREWVTVGLGRIPGLTGDDIVLHGDVDEIVDPLFVRNARPKRGELVTFGQRFHCFAVDWLHPEHWWGTVATTVDTIADLGERPYKKIRNARGGVGPMSLTMLDRPPDHFALEVDPAGPKVTGRRLPHAGWHFTWMGGKEASLSKLNSFCHPEIADRTYAKLQRDLFTIEGEHVDGTRLMPVDVDDTYPQWIRDGRAPASWFRARPDVTFTEDWFGAPSCEALARLVKRVADVPGLIVEIGSWEGRSTIAMANAAYPRQVEAVDTWAGSPGEISADLARDRDVYATWCQNVVKATKGNVLEHVMGWRDYFPTIDQPVALVFIDAEHTYEEVRDTIEAFRPLMAPGGIICGDDVHHPPIVRAVVDTLGSDVTVDASLWIWKA